MFFLDNAATRFCALGQASRSALAVIEGTVFDASGSADAQVRYLRLEYDADPLMLGALFSHPVAHVHAQPSEAPRFSLEIGAGQFILIEFLDFLYRNFCHSARIRWADSVWRKTAPDVDSGAHFNAIRNFFLAEGGPGKRARLGGRLALCQDWLPRIKTALRAEKAEMPMNLAVDNEHFRLFSYHL